MTQSGQRPTDHGCCRTKVECEETKRSVYFTTVISCQGHAFALCCVGRLGGKVRMFMSGGMKKFYVVFFIAKEKCSWSRQPI